MNRRAVRDQIKEVLWTVPETSLEILQSFGTLKLNLWIGEAFEMVSALEKPCDVWFLDGHSPK